MWIRMTDGTQDYKTLRVPEQAWEDAKQQKEASGRTWGEQIVRPECDNPSTTDEEGSTTIVESNGVGDDVLDRLEQQLTYDDAVTACRTALREELPDQVLQG